MKKLFFLPLIFTLFFNSNVNASHAAGGDLTYLCLGGNDYRITFVFYRDCSAGTNPNGNNAGAPTTATISIQSISCSQSFTVSLPKVPGSGQVITPVCPMIGSPCGSNNYYFGVQEHVYTIVLTLPPCSDWSMSFTLCCRNNPINTILNPGGQSMYIKATLNNLAAPCNSSPQFSNKPAVRVCTGQTFCFNHGAIDPDGDSLSFEFVNPYTSATAQVSYLAGYSAQQFLPSTPPITLDPVTGDLCMNPTFQIITVTAILVKEWRKINGIMTVIGTVIRDMQFMAENFCTNHLPTVAGIDTTAVQYDPNDTIYQISHCVGRPLSFNVYPYDQDTIDNLNMSWNNGIPSGNWSVTGNNTQNPVGSFSWTPNSSHVSNTPHVYTVTIKDDACPYNGTQTFGFAITVRGSVADLGPPDTLLCQGEVADFIAHSDTNGVNWIWWLDGVQQPGPYFMDSIFTINSNTMTPGMHTLEVEVDDGSVTQLCPGKDMIKIKIVRQPDVDLGNDTILCEGEMVSIDAGQGVIYTWNTGGTTQTIVADSTGTYSVTVDGGNGTRCKDSDDILVTVLPMPPINLGPDVCSPTPFTLDAGVPGPGFFYTWGPNGEITQTITANTTGTYSVTVTALPGYRCETYDDIVVTVIPDAIIDLGPDLQICRHEKVTLDALNNGPYSYYWMPTFETTPTILLHRLEAEKTHMYTVAVTGCNTITDTIFIDVASCDLTIPNIITPNNDGWNDNLRIENLRYYENSQMIIYNRWGKKVYDNPQYDRFADGDGWDAANLPDGVYYFILKINDGEEITLKQGSITVIGKIK